MPPRPLAQLLCAGHPERQTMIAFSVCMACVLALTAVSRAILQVTDHLDRARARLRLSSSAASKYGARGARHPGRRFCPMLIPQLPIMGRLTSTMVCPRSRKNRDRPA